MKSSCTPGRQTLAALVTVLLALASPRPGSADPIITNGDFELGNTAFASDYVFSPGNILGLQTYDIVTDPSLSSIYATSYRDHTSGSGRMLAANGAMIPNATVWSQTVAVRPGANYDFSIWASSWYPLSPARLDFLFNDVSIGTFTVPEGAGVWREFSTSWNSGSNTSLTIRIVDRNTDFSGNDFALDDISLVGPAAQVVPEPTSLSLLGVGFASALGYRRLRFHRPSVRWLRSRR